MSKLNRNAKLAFYAARKRKGDVKTLTDYTLYSPSHVSNVLAGRRAVPQFLADVMYQVSRRRTKTSELASF